MPDRADEIAERIYQTMRAYGQDCAEAGPDVVNPEFYREHLDRHLRAHIAAARQAERQHWLETIIAAMNADLPPEEKVRLVRADGIRLSEEKA